jgi:hypothetical protein
MGGVLLGGVLLNPARQASVDAVDDTFGLGNAPPPASHNPLSDSLPNKNPAETVHLHRKKSSPSAKTSGNSFAFPFHIKEVTANLSEPSPDGRSEVDTPSAKTPSQSFTPLTSTKISFALPFLSKSFALPSFSHPAQVCCSGVFVSRLMLLVQTGLLNVPLPLNIMDDTFSDREIYCNQLLRQKRGFPLYIPRPQRNLPAEYQIHGVTIGDVGRITPEGIFDFFFNIYLPVDHPINNNNVPEDFCPLQLYAAKDVFNLDFDPGTCVSTSSIQRLDIHDPLL